MAFERLTPGLQQLPQLLMQAQMAAWTEQNRRRNAALQGGQQISDALLKGLGLYGDIKQGEKQMELQERQVATQEGGLDLAREGHELSVSQALRAAEMEDEALEYERRMEERGMKVREGELAETKRSNVAAEKLASQKAGQDVLTEATRRGKMEAEIKVLDKQYEDLQAGGLDEMKDSQLHDRSLSLADSRIKFHMGQIRQAKKELLDRYQVSSLDELMQKYPEQAAKELKNLEGLEAENRAELQKFMQVFAAVAVAGSGVEAYQNLRAALQGQFSGPDETPLPSQVMEELDGMDPEAFRKAAEQRVLQGKGEG